MAIPYENFGIKTGVPTSNLRWWNRIPASPFHGNINNSCIWGRVLAGMLRKNLRINWNFNESRGINWNVLLRGFTLNVECEGFTGNLSYKGRNVSY